MKRESPLEFVNLEMGMYIFYPIYHLPFSLSRTRVCGGADDRLKSVVILRDSESVMYVLSPPLSVFHSSQCARWWTQTALRRSNGHGRLLPCRAVAFTQRGRSLQRIPCCLIGATWRPPWMPLTPSHRYYFNFHPGRLLHDENNRICWGPLQTRKDTI